nr:MAG TPA: hypothetical protein [Caudoviricetes sp.]
MLYRTFVLFRLGTFGIAIIRKTCSNIYTYYPLAISCSLATSIFY